MEDAISMPPVHKIPKQGQSSVLVKQATRILALAQQFNALVKSIHSIKLTVDETALFYFPTSNRELPSEERRMRSKFCMLQ